MKELTFNLQLFANATVTTGSTGALDATNTNTVPYPGHAYANPNTDLAPEMKVFYEKQLLREAAPNLVHNQFGQKRSIPKGGGKTIEFRKFSSLPKATTPISEGVKPSGQSMSVSTVVGTVDQYGDYIDQTDVLELTAIDNTISEANKMLGDQAGRTLDTITRNVLQSNTNIAYCPTVSGSTETPVTKPYGLNSTARMTVKQIKKMVTALKNQNAPKINGSYVCIMHPSVFYDLNADDDDFIDVMKYATPETMLTGEVGKIAGCRIVESTEAKIHRPYIMLGTNKVYSLTVNADATSSATKKAVVKGALTAASSLTGKTLYLNGDSTKAFTVKAVEYTSGQTVSTIEFNENTYESSAAVIKENDILVPSATWSASDGSPIYSTLFLGANAFGVVDVEGGGLQMIVKQLGSAGTADPLNQVSSEGWKALATAVILNPAYMINCFSCSSEFDVDEN